MKICCKCKIEKEINLFNKNKSKKDGLSSYCKICSNKYSSKYRLNNLEYFQNYIYDENYNKNYFQKFTKNKRIERKKKDYLFKLKCNLHSRTSNIFRKKKFKKDNSTHELLGCTYDFIINYLSSKFEKNMSFSNYGK